MKKTSFGAISAQKLKKKQRPVLDRIVELWGGQWLHPSLKEKMLWQRKNSEFARGLTLRRVSCW
jgi:hypothetical protein